MVSGISLTGLKYRVNVGLDYSQDQAGTYFGPNTFYNASTSLASASESVGNAEAYTYTIENVLTYDKTIAEKNRVNLPVCIACRRIITRPVVYSEQGYLQTIYRIII